MWEYIKNVNLFSSRWVDSCHCLLSSWRHYSVLFKCITNIRLGQIEFAWFLTPCHRTQRNGKTNWNLLVKTRVSAPGVSRPIKCEVPLCLTSMAPTRGVDGEGYRLTSRGAQDNLKHRNFSALLPARFQLQYPPHPEGLNRGEEQNANEQRT